MLFSVQSNRAHDEVEREGRRKVEKDGQHSCSKIAHVAWGTWWSDRALDDSTENQQYETSRDLSHEVTAAVPQGPPNDGAIVDKRLCESREQLTHLRPPRIGF